MPVLDTYRARIDPLLNDKPEWIRVPSAIRIFGLGRSVIYELIAEGKIKSASLRKRNAQRGTRLINRDSLAAFIDSHTTEK
jgi:Helix-turn-helix domain